jgi:hypothetical protein
MNVISELAIKVAVGIIYLGFTIAYGILCVVAMFRGRR